MAQNTIVMAFRKRLKNKGYTNISIKKLKGYIGKLYPNTYEIKAIEPLGKNSIIAHYNMTEMYNAFK